MFNQKSLIKNEKKNIWDYFNSYSKPAGHLPLLKRRVNGHIAALSLENRDRRPKPRGCITVNELSEGKELGKS